MLEDNPIAPRDLCGCSGLSGLGFHLSLPFFLELPSRARAPIGASG
jgi:hypothetical protein